MKKIIVGVLSCMLLAGCVTDEPVYYRTQTIVVEVPKQLYRCPDVKVMKKAYLTERDIAALLIQYHAVRAQCKASLDAIQTYLKKAKAQVETTN